MKRHDESTSDRLRRMAATDELSVGRGRAEHVAARALARAVSRPRTRMLAAAIAGSAFAVVSVTGIGAIADQAVPGDSLYAIDRAYESVGRAIGRNPDRTQETLIEALALAQRGDRDRAYLHVATELGAFNVQTPEGFAVGEPDDVSNDASVAASEDTPATTASSLPTVAAAAAQSAETAPATTSTTAVEEVDDVATKGDPFILALENALRASQLAVDAPDAESAVAATEAVRSVVKLAVGATEIVSGQQAQAAPTLSSTTTTQPATSSTTTTTTTKPKTGGNGAGTTTTTTAVTNSSTTTTVPIDSGTTTPGDGETAGGNSGGSQQGSGSSGGSGSGSTQPPIILPIP